MMEAFYRQTPLWLLIILVFFFLLAFLLVGYALRRRQVVAIGTGGDDAPFESLAASAVLGLLALLLGFTFSMALDRFDARRTMTLQEANAIGTMYLRSQLMDEPYRSGFRQLFEHYTAHRIAFAKASNPGIRRRMLAETEAYQQRIATVTLAASRPVRDTEFAVSFVESVNATLDIGAARKAARLATIPTRVLSVLLIYMAVTAMIVGFVMWSSRGRWAAAALLLLLSMSYGLILDIDQPNRGGIRESQIPMEDLLRSIRAG